MKLHRYRTLLCAACCFALALVAAAPGRAIGATMTITTIDDLQKIGNDPGFPLDGTYVLGSDIDASATSTWNSGAGFAPIGASSPYYTGSLDGQGHVIRNLFINRPGTDDVGLFGDVESGGLIKNLGLDNATVTGRNEVGILAGYVDYVAIVNCHSKGTVTGVEYIGGLVGESDAGDIASCYSTAAVSGTDWSTGGLVGYNEYTNITSCYATGAVSGNG